MCLLYHLPTPLFDRMRPNTVGVVAVVALVALAGCAGFAPSGSQEASPTGDSPETAEPTDESLETAESTDMMDDDSDATADSGTVRFYISDEENAIGDFEHLNVTITEVGFQAAGDVDVGTDDGETDGDADKPENDTIAPPENTTDAGNDETEIPENNETEAPDDETEAPDDETEAPDDETEALDDETEAPDDETEIPENNETEAPDDEDESGEWVEHEVDDRTFDLTQLQGANASLLEEFGVPEGSYNKVFVHVAEINGTLENGESVNVKLPSEKLQITGSFTVEANDSVEFVFDITVHKAGNSGKYILTPVISESGTDVPIEDVDEEREEDAEDEREDESDDEREDEREDESDDEGEDEREDESDDETSAVETELNASFVGSVGQGENATIHNDYSHFLPPIATPVDGDRP